MKTKTLPYWFLPTMSLRLRWTTFVFLLLTCRVSQTLDIISNDIDGLFDKLNITNSSYRSTVDDSQVRKQWGLPDTTTQVGQLFRYHIPIDAFTGKVHHYKVNRASSEVLPDWLQFNESMSTLEGVPTSRDVGQIYLVIKAFGHPDIDGKSSSVEDVFTLDVRPYVRNPKPTFLLKDAGHISTSCDPQEDSTSMSIVLDVDLYTMTPSERIRLMNRLMESLGIAENRLRIFAYEYSDQVLNSNTVMAGPGNALQKLTLGVVAYWQVECGPWTGFDAHDAMINAVERNSRDGSLAQALGAPVIGWHLSVVRPQAAAIRERRQIGYGIIPTPVPGAVVPTKDNRHSIDNDPEREETEAARIDDDEGPTPDVRIIPTMASPTFTMASMSTHRHRHHHELGPYPRGSHHDRHQLNYPYDVDSSFTATPSLNYFRGTPVLSTPSPTPALHPWTRSTVHPEMSDILSVVIPTETFPSTKPMKPLEIIPTRTLDLPVTTKIVSPPDVTHHNFRPVIRNRIKKLSFIAGKITYFQVPANTFFDFEQGEATELKLILMNADGTALHVNSWIQFDSEKQTIYAIPLEENIGKWDFILEAMDNEGDSVRESVEVHVRQHPSSRAVHHEFVLHLKYDRWRFPYQIDWQVKLADKLAQFFGDSDPSSIVVRSITLDPVIFTWTNDSLLSQACPQDKILDLMHEMATREGNPTKYLRKILTPEFRVQKVVVNFLGHCMGKPPPMAPTHVNFKPEVRNQIDEISVTAGEFLLFKVPDDTFNDEEDGDASHLHLTFLTIYGAEMPHTYWLKFDRQQREFIGLPMDEDVGRREYQLVATDKNGSSVADALEVIVHPRLTERRPSVEFSLYIDTDFDAFNNDLFKKVMVLDKLAHLFDDVDPRYITVHSITRGSVVFAWSNKTLPDEPCPKDAILRLVGIMFNENGTVSQRTIKIFSPDFNITGANVMPLGECLAGIERGPTPVLPPIHVTPGMPPLHRPDHIPTESTETATSDDEAYVTTIIPAVVIAIMLLVAAIIACALYRKRRKGTMTMDSDNGNFVNKGIPIIFADELVDKPDPAKSPVILKEEKPPLPPPQYPRSSGSASPSTPPPPSQRAPDRPSSRGRIDPRHPSMYHGGDRDRYQHPNRNGSGRGEDDHLLGPDPNENTPPYQPPPPFTASRDSRLSRPKHTPTYRLPPPYVPP